MSATASSEPRVNIDLGDGIEFKLPSLKKAHIVRYVVWDTCNRDENTPDEELNGTLYVLVGYCPDSLPYFVALFKNTLQLIGDEKVDVNTSICGKVNQSMSMKNFTLLRLQLVEKGKREINGFTAIDHLDIYY